MQISDQIYKDTSPGIAILLLSTPQERLGCRLRCIWQNIVHVDRVKSG
jgi:hypothetical protein